MDLIRAKLDQAKDLVARSDVDAWLTFVRETSSGGDPVLPFLLDGSLTWQSALIVFRNGRTVAIVGSYDAPPLAAAGHWDEVLPYVQSVREPLLDALGQELPRGGRIAINMSMSDDKADGLTHGMYLSLSEMLKGRPFELTSAESIVLPLRSIKTAPEVARIRGAIDETESIFGHVAEWVQTGPTEGDLYRRIQRWVDDRGYGYSWDRTGDPIVNMGPNSMIGHGVPSDQIRLEPGHILHIDLGIVSHGYSSDIQRCWYVRERGETAPPADVQRALLTVVGAISAGAAELRPGIEGWQVDAAARRHLVHSGHPEYDHALGHQVGRLAHDGGGILGPRWERYGGLPTLPVEAGQVYTLELGVVVPGRGYLGLEEMVLVREDGIEWLTERQLDMPLL